MSVERTGGSYVVQPDGSELRQEGTVPHAAGDAPRTADGLVVRDGNPPAPQPASKPPRTAKKEG
jgi:hypothetical protein